jgi:phospholipid/cholesterol/gamma-HCH transport system substrate-binding protein
METRAHYVAVGSFVLALIALAGVAILWLAQVQFTTQYVDYEIYFGGQVSGLNVGSTVTYSGIPVGRVLELGIDPENVRQIRVLVEIDGKTVIKTDAKAEIETNLLSGVSTIEIHGGSQTADLLKPQPGKKYAVIEPRRSAFAKVAATAPELIDKAMETLANFNTLLDEHNRQAFADSLDNVRVFTASLADDRKAITDTIASANTALAELGTLLHNVDESYTARDGLKNQLNVTLGDYDKLAKGLLDTNHQLQLTVQDVQPGVQHFSQHTINQVDDLLADARQLVASLTRLSSQIERDPTRVLFGDRRQGYSPK